jgi:hypothetical protein
MTESPTAVIDCPDTTAGTAGETDGEAEADVAGAELAGPELAGAVTAAPDVPAVLARTAGCRQAPGSRACPALRTDAGPPAASEAAVNSLKLPARQHATTTARTTPRRRVREGRR